MQILAGTCGIYGGKWKTNIALHKIKTRKKKSSNILMPESTAKPLSVIEN